MQLHGGAPLLANNLITGNSYTNGFAGSGVRAGGVWIANGIPFVINNTIVANSLTAPGAVASGALGAGIWISGGNPILINDIVADNNANANGGGAAGGISKTGTNSAPALMSFDLAWPFCEVSLQLQQLHSGGTSVPAPQHLVQDLVILKGCQATVGSTIQMYRRIQMSSGKSSFLTKD